MPTLWHASCDDGKGVTLSKRMLSSQHVKESTPVLSYRGEFI